MIARKKSLRQRRESGARAGRSLDWRHGGFFVLGALLAGITGFVAPTMVSRSSGRRPVPAAQSKPGPIAASGQLEYQTIELERPDDTLVYEGKAVPPTQWFFERHTENQILSLFQNCGLTADQQQALADKSHWQPIPNGWLILPSREIVANLSPASRKQLYAELGKSPRNLFQCHPFTMPAERFDGWLANCGLPEDKRELFRRMTYAEGSVVYFADFEVIEAACTVPERKRLAKAVSRTTALLMSLRVTPESDLEALSQYWGGGGRGQAMRPFLESLSRFSEGTAISVSYFFPTFARMRLYTYPDSQNDPSARMQDCFWTALNFFNEQPDDRFFDAGDIQRALATEYEEVTADWTFGDLLLVLQNGTNAVHLCVYIADDVVFTKNGVDYLQPWVLMRIPEMLRHYPSERSTRLLGFRRKQT